jgi:hypothetical protein
LDNFWVENTRIELAETQKGEFERLRELHESILRECNEGKEEVRGCSLWLSAGSNGCPGPSKFTAQHRYHWLYHDWYVCFLYSAKQLHLRRDPR